jgi:flagellum-specific peptidoglycan hydrolase FlgJ
MSKQSDFINKHKQAVIEATHNTGIFPSVKMSQMILESGWGESANAKLANNYFGIKKGVGWEGETISLKTPKDASKVNVFRKYPTPYDSIVDHSSFLIKNKRYENAGVFKAKTPEEQIKAIAKAGYAEAGDYVPKIMSVIKSNDLTKLDDEAKAYKPKPIIDNQKGTNWKTVFATALGLVAIYVVYNKVIKKK